jgi:predicted AAA+ superfamily ATPase
MDYKTTEYDGITLSEYKGTYSIEALKTKDDKFYPVWARYQKGRDEFQDKAWPVKVILGTKEQAKTTLLKLIAELGNEQAPLDDSVPF